MQKARRQFLARSLRTRNHDAAVRRRHLLDALPQVVHDRRFADQVRAVVALLLQLLVFAAQLRSFERAGHDEHEPVRLEGLLDVFVGAALDGGDGGFDIAMAADDDDRQLRMELLDAGQHVQAVELGALQPDIEDDQRRPPLLDGAQAPRRYPWRALSYGLRPQECRRRALECPLRRRQSECQTPWLTPSFRAKPQLRRRSRAPCHSASVLRFPLPGRPRRAISESTFLSMRRANILLPQAHLPVRARRRAAR